MMLTKIFKSKDGVPQDVLMMRSLADPMAGEFFMKSEYSVNFTLKVSETPTFLKTKWFY